EEALRQDLRLDVVADPLLGAALRGERGPELLVVPLKVLLLELVDPRLHVLVGDDDAEVLALLRELGPLDEELDDLTLERLVVGRARLREGSLLQLVGGLRL